MNAVSAAEGGETVGTPRSHAKAVASARAVGPDILRALAILLVMLWHVPKGTTPAALDSIRSFSWAGVDIFFVLSGYLIGGQLLAPVAAGRAPNVPVFYMRRAFRILPAYLVALAVFAALPQTREAPVMAPLWRFLTFTMNFGLDYSKTGVFTQAWSLCVEAHFYLLLPLIVLTLRPARSAVPTLMLAGAILIAGIAVRCVIWQAAVGAPIASHTYYGPSYLRAIYYPTYCRLDGLMFGVLLAAARTFMPERWRKWAPPQVKLALGFIILAVGLILFADHTGMPGYRMPVLSLIGAALGYPVFALGVMLILAALLEAEPLLARWRLPGVSLVAGLSYSLYLTHKSVMNFDRTWLGAERLHGWAGIFVYLATSLVVAAALYLAIERPFLMLRDRIGRRRT